ncbi:type IX secretion system sortase PorU [Wenyingzhuangia sp. IMCC45533]
MKLRSLLCFFLFVALVSAQNKKTFTVKLNTIYDPVIEKTIYSGDHITLGDGFVPLYIHQEKKNKNGEIVNISYKVLRQKKRLIKDLLVTQEKISPEIDLRVFTVKDVDKEYITFSFNPVYKNSKQEFFEIQEIEVNYSIKTKSKFSKVNRTNANSESFLASGTWYKIAVDKTGVYKLDYNFLKSLGIDVDNINPKRIRVLGYGGQVLPEDLGVSQIEGLQENAIQVIGEEDNVFNRDDVVLFYGQGTITWDLTNRNQITHRQNIYSSRGYYFINVDSGIDGKRIQNIASPLNAATNQINTFTDYQLHEQELFNYIRVGRQWFGEDFSVNRNQNFNFIFPNIVRTTSVILSTGFASNSASTSVNFNVNYNGNVLINRAIQNTNPREGFTNINPSANFLAAGDNININVFYNSNGDNSAISRLDYLRVVADRSLIANGTQFGFVNFQSQTNSQVLEYTINKKNEIDYIWNVTDVYNVKNQLGTNVSSSSFKFKELTDGILNRYHLVKINRALSPINLGSNSRVSNQNLQAINNAQYVIIANKNLISQANRIKTYHEQNTYIDEAKTTKIKVEVVDIQQIYNEFGSGNSDITAIRNFFKFLYDKNTSAEQRLKYVCLFGDSTFDYRNIQTRSENSIPTFMSLTNSSSLISSFNTDDYYAYMDEVGRISPSVSSWKMDLITGRIPVSNANEARTVVDKILNYYAPNSFGAWKNQVTLLGDDGQEGDNQGLIEHLEDSAKKITGFVNSSNIEVEGNDENLNVVKLYSDAFEEQVTSGGQSYPEVKRRFLQAFDNGSLVINYFGHGNVFSLAEENFLDISDIGAIRNKNNLPLFITVTCDFSRFDDPVRVSGGEELMLNSLGGAVSMITTTRQITITAGAKMNNLLSDYLFRFDGKKRTIAESLKDAKNVNFDRDKFFVFYFGDPLMNLSIPDNKIKINDVKKIVTTDPNEIKLESVSTLKALARHRITGEIVDKSDNTINSFNGKLDIIIYGKELERSTRLNEEGGVNSGNQSEVTNFNSLENKLFVGTASVKNGMFAVDFILPKDIGFIEESTKFSVYAASNSNEATGFDKTYIVGGIDTDVEEDKTPPMLNLFMEDKSFLDGGSTTTRPRFIANIQDQSGINISLNSIGRNLSLVIDGDFSNPINLNDFYTTEPDDFTRGVVNYELEQLEIGNHTVTFKAWDTHNNSATQTLNFTVVEDREFKIDRVLNYPNPFINHTEFWFSNNRVGNPLEVKVQIYTISGKLVKSIFATDGNNNGGNIVRSVTWDGKDDFGNRLAKGVYLYKIIVKETLSGETDERIEKLVIL